MRIEPAIASRYLEQAAVEQLSRQLRHQGYEVERDAAIGALEADLIARRGSDVVVFEFKVPNQGAEAAVWARETARRREQARALGAHFRLILVRPPRETQVEIDGIEQALEEALRRCMPPALRNLSERTWLDEVIEVAITSLAVHGESIEVAGDATAVVTLCNGEGDLTETFPFTFEAVLDRGSRISELRHVEVDTSSWHADRDESGGEAHAPDRRV